eukprot:Seg3398.2 transcript_id=Seg3398.2/GoldUCD/mRNA.D3Y31 product="hypothetical protein" protein_id=Seg3398.2/GoldUCD/D3Y31
MGKWTSEVALCTPYSLKLRQGRCLSFMLLAHCKMAACKQLSRKIHLQSSKQASRGVLEKLKSLIGIDSNLQNVDVTNSERDQLKGQFLHSNVQKRMANVTSKSLGVNSSDNWHEIPVIDLNSRFKLIKGCHEEFGSVPPNNIINNSKCVKDYAAYYETVRRPGIIPEMWKLQNQELPTNLSFEAPQPFKKAKEEKKRRQSNF